LNNSDLFKILDGKLFRLIADTISKVIGKISRTTRLAAAGQGGLEAVSGRGIMAS